MKYKVKIRRGGKFTNNVRANAEQLNNNIYNFEKGWLIGKGDHSLYQGETAMTPRDSSYPKDAPPWIASGDLINSNDELIKNAKELKEQCK